MAAAKSKLKLHSSNFFITLNSNSTDLEYKSLLIEAFEEYYANIEVFLTATDPELVDSVDAPTALCEVGPKKKRVHLHAYISQSNTEPNVKSTYQRLVRSFGKRSVLIATLMSVTFRIRVRIESTIFSNRCEKLMIKNKNFLSYKSR
jgi:hypothetical protein